VEVLPVLWRFSLYGFLKNQRYFDAFWILAFLEKDLSFFTIGLLFGFREVLTNLLEIPSGALADVWGRRKSMVLSLTAYIASFLVFGLARDTLALFGAMALFSVGDAFRTGTHKAIIFSWLRLHGRQAERTRIYGFTRSWSKIGSAISVLIAAFLVFYSEDYSQVFLYSAIPYVIGIFNILGYPRELDRPHAPPSHSVLRHLRSALRETLTDHGIRSLVLQSMGFEGVFKAVKDYLQPVLAAAAIVLLADIMPDQGLSPPQKAALFVGPVYFLLFLLSAVASRNAHRLLRTDVPGDSEDRLARFLWMGLFLCLACLGPLLYFELHLAVIGGFVALHVLQNFWRPVLIARIDSRCHETRSATILSVESQGKNLATMVLAPLLGAAVDLARTHDSGGPFWPVAVISLGVAVIFFLASRWGASRKTCLP
jgi:MFS family permease